jgi:hypothetical protein
MEEGVGSRLWRALLLEDPGLSRPPGPAPWRGGRRWWSPPAPSARSSPPRRGLPRAGLVGLAAAALVSWRLRFRPSEQARTWQRGAHGERRTARLLDRLTCDGYVAFHDLAIPGSPANIDHL